MCRMPSFPACCAGFLGSKFVSVRFSWAAFPPLLAMLLLCSTSMFAKPRIGFSGMKISLRG
jgi:hypothetical protein